MRYFLLFPLTILFSLNLYSQNSDWEEVLYLKDGSVIHGIIIEQVPGESIKIQTENNNIHSFEMDEVLRITKEKVQESEDLNKLSSAIVSINYLAGVNEHRGNLVGFKAFYGFYITPHLNLGAGVGFNKMSDFSYIPITLDLTFEFIKTESTPFFKFNGGLAYLESNSSPNLIFEPSFGLKQEINKNTDLYLSIGLTFLEKESVIPGPQTVVIGPVWFNEGSPEAKYAEYIKFSLGLAF